MNSLSLSLSLSLNREIIILHLSLSLSSLQGDNYSALISIQHFDDNKVTPTCDARLCNQLPPPTAP